MIYILFIWKIHVYFKYQTDENALYRAPKLRLSLVNNFLLSLKLTFVGLFRRSLQISFPTAFSPLKKDAKRFPVCRLADKH